MTTSATIAGPRRPAGNVGIVSQSGVAGQVNVMWRAHELGLGVSYQVSCGNSADLDIVDFIRFMAEDAASDVILVLAEHIPDGGRLFEAARIAADRAKPIVMVKLGRTEAGTRGGVIPARWRCRRICDAALRRAASSVSMMQWPARPRCCCARDARHGARAAATTISGGNGVLLVDLGGWHLVAEYGPATRTPRRGAAWGSSANLTDVTTWRSANPTSSGAVSRRSPWTTISTW
jgi:acetyltransferase